MKIKEQEIIKISFNIEISFVKVFINTQLNIEINTEMA